MKRLRHITPDRSLVVALVALLAGYPLLRLLLVPLLPGLAPTPAVANDDPLLASPAVLNSVRIGVETGIAALLPGFAIGYMLERLTGPAARLLGATLWLLLLTPSFLLCAGWQLFVALPVFAGTPAYDLLFSECGIVALLVLKGMPFAVFAARTAWATIGGEIGAAARIHVRQPWRRGAILGRLLLPAAGAVFAVAFIEGVADFGVAAVLGAHLHMPLVIYGVYTALARTPIDFAEAARLSIVLIMLALVAVGVHQWLNTKAAGPGSRSRPLPPRSMRPAETLFVGAVVGALAACAFVMPTIGLIGRALAFGETTHLASGQWYSLLYSACYAFVAATLSIGLALALLGGRKPPKRGSARFTDLLTLGAMAVPGIVLGAAYVVAFNGWLPLYGTPLLLLLGLVATHLPLAMRFLQGPLASVHAGLADAATLHGMRRHKRIELVHAPLLLRPLLWGWALAFGGIFFELPLASLLYPMGRAPVGVELLSLDETLRFADEARLALAGIVTCLAIVGVVVSAVPRWLARRHPPHPDGRHHRHGRHRLGPDRHDHNHHAPRHPKPHSPKAELRS